MGCPAWPLPHSSLTHALAAAHLFLLPISGVFLMELWARQSSQPPWETPGRFLLMMEAFRALSFAGATKPPAHFLPVKDTMPKRASHFLYSVFLLLLYDP